MYTEKELYRFKSNICPFFKDCMRDYGYCSQIKNGICESVPSNDIDSTENIEISHAEKLRDLNSYDF